MRLFTISYCALLRKQQLSRGGFHDKEDGEDRGQESFLLLLYEANN